MPADVAEAFSRLPARAGGLTHVTWFTSAASTNDIAARLAEGGAPHMAAVVAEQQTAGRGRLGRTWFSPPGAGLYVSFVLRLVTEPGAVKSVPGSAAGLVSLTAGVAFAEAVRLCTHLPVAIKWPNDLVMDRRKLAGILTETSGTGTFEYVVVGFGLNLRPAAYPPDIADRATSVEAELGRPVERGILLAQCVESMALWTDALGAGKGAQILDRWRALAPSVRGSRVRCASPAGPLEGIADGIDDDGALRVRTDGGINRIIAGEVTWL